MSDNSLLKSIPIKKALETEMTRTQFIKQIGIVVAGAIGFGNLLGMILKDSSQPRLLGRKATKGFGSNKFGI